MSIVFAIGILLVVGYLGGRLARKVKIPEVTGYIIAGILIGPSCFHLIPKIILEEELNWVVDIALGVIAFAIGGSLDIKRIGKLGKNVLLITLLQGIGAFVFVTFSILLLSPYISKIVNFQGSILPFALVMGAIGTATAPAATLAVMNELKAKGPLTTTALAVVALDDALAIIIFGICNATALSSTSGSLTHLKAISIPFIEIVGSLALGIAFGFLLRLISGYIRSAAGFLIMSLGIICVVSGIAIFLKLSLLLANMVSGFIIINGLKRDQRFISVLDNFTPPLYAAFFALSGTYLRVGTLIKVGLLGLVFIVARAVGKIAGASIGGVVSGAPVAVKKYLGLTLLPQAGVAIGLVLIAYENPGFKVYGDMMINIILASIAVNEIIGPLATVFAIRHAGEAEIKVK
ncbi:cation:proton antiporter [candidate division WOR-3 bacterium]|nr:cation:proton antiporter [candidate division WOR-3 bacterium]